MNFESASGKKYNQVGLAVDVCVSAAALEREDSMDVVVAVRVAPRARHGRKQTARVLMRSLCPPGHTFESHKERGRRDDP